MVYRPLAVDMAIFGGGHVGVQSLNMASDESALFPCYKATLADLPSKQRYEEKIGGQDPYEMPKKAWVEDIDKWPSTTYIHVDMYLAFSLSPYTRDDLLNYKSLECYQRFVAGWVRDVLVMLVPVDDRMVVTAKVRYCSLISMKAISLFR